MPQGHGCEVSETRAEWLGRHILPHEPALRHWLSCWQGWGVDVDDIVQETYAILAARESVSEIRNPRAYCFQTARSVVLMYRRSRKVVPIRDAEPIDDLELAADQPTPEEMASDQQQLARLADAMRSLPDKPRRALSLRIAEGLTQREIGERMGISENAAQKHIAKSILSLMNMLGRGRDHRQEAALSSHRNIIEDASFFHGYARNQSGD